ncbi:MAG: glucose-6-phosphate isomerase [Chloroflexi bacterium]|nr:glucose-6-phosphate isomerase [Chloroflexota bacterium]
MNISIGKYLANVESALADLERQRIIERIWQEDHTIWKPDPTEITNRLGWLTITDLMRGQISALNSFAREVRKDGFRHIVLLGMGGSSLGAEVLSQTFGSADGYPELIVLDSTLPDSVQAVTDAIDPAHTLFIVSSKSGTTIEPICLWQYFKEMVIAAAGKERAGRNFIAITDHGTPLANLAKEERFRRVFLNPTDIGGRYSVLSLFGLVPAALIGIDITLLLDRADKLRARCIPSQSTSENPGAHLGAIIGTLALQKRDKLTLLVSPAISSLGLWVEQLLAESTGKEGKGIVPVVDEPALEPSDYGTDRLFVFLRLENDNNSAIDAAVTRLKAAGQPVVLIEIPDIYALGAEFFRWELATAVAGAMLGINPFDQPDVTRAKQETDRVLQTYTTSGKPPETEAINSLASLLAKAGAGTYLAVLAYLKQNPNLGRLMTDFRRRVAQKYHIATTVGYGPRYLHSSGQLHKGGPDTGLFLEITTGHEKDIPIPGKTYTFGILAAAQALGDLQALRQLERNTARIHLSRPDITTLSKLFNELP